jgi:hypothetical protein
MKPCRNPTKAERRNVRDRITDKKENVKVSGCIRETQKSVFSPLTMKMNLHELKDVVF